MEYINKIDWSLVWGIIKDTIIPHSGTLLFNFILFLVIGLFLSICYIILLSKKKVLKRKPKYYNWAVKLYTPLLLGLFLYIFGQIGFLRGVYKVIIKEKEVIISSIYDNTLSVAFESEQSKNIFVEEMQLAAKEAKDGSNVLLKQLKESTQNYNTGNSLIDGSKNKIATYLIDSYGNDIYKITTYGMLNLANRHVNVSESMTYSEFSSAMDFLLEVEHKEIELAIREKLTTWFVSLLDSQYMGLVKSLLILLLIGMAFPVIEFFIYKKWIEPRVIKNELEK